MNIKIWSDVVCPFCYIGKRKLEKALQNLNINDYEIEWKSFQLNPNAAVSKGESALDHLSKSKGWDMEQTLQIAKQTTERAALDGLEFHFERAIAANTLNAHRLIHWASQFGKTNNIKEALLSAYFTEGKDVGDIDALGDIAAGVGLDKQAALQMLKQAMLYHNEVLHDQKEAQILGIQGVPFFVFNDKYALSGAQPVEVFESALQQAAEVL